MRKRSRSANAIFLFVLFAAATSSGGVLLGIGTLANRLKSEGVFTNAELNIIFDGSFQVLTWDRVTL